MTGRRGGAEQQGQLLPRVAHARLTLDERLAGRLDGIARVERPPRATEPAPVREPRRETPLDLRVLLEPEAGGVDDEHLARTEPPAAHPRAFGQGNRAGLGRACDEPARRDGVAERPQPVPVERRADDTAVGEDERGRPVPRLDERGLVVVERALGNGLRLVVLPRGRHEHLHGVARVPPRSCEQGENIVEQPRV